MRVCKGNGRGHTVLVLHLLSVLPVVCPVQCTKPSRGLSCESSSSSRPKLLPLGRLPGKQIQKMDIRTLSNSELKEQLLKHGVNPGPILPSTRGVYENKLKQLLEKEQVQENGDTHEDQYSDSDDEGAQFKGAVGMRNEINGDGEESSKNYSHTNMDRRSSLGQAGIKNKDGKNWPLKSQPENTAASDFPDLLSETALGMSATRRKPIKGAAGRPIQFQYDDIVIRARMKEQTKEMTEEKKPQRRLVSIPLQILIFVLVAFTVLVFITMEGSPENPFEPTMEDKNLQLP